VSAAREKLCSSLDPRVFACLLAQSTAEHRPQLQGSVWSYSSIRTHGLRLQVDRFASVKLENVDDVIINVLLLYRHHPDNGDIWVVGRTYTRTGPVDDDSDVQSLALTENLICVPADAVKAGCCVFTDEDGSLQLVYVTD